MENGHTAKEEEVWFIKIERILNSEPVGKINKHLEKHDVEG